MTNDIKVEINIDLLQLNLLNLYITKRCCKTRDRLCVGESSTSMDPRYNCPVALTSYLQY